MTDADEPRRSVLLVDFDNIFSGLQKLDPAAATTFATDPLRWLGWLARGDDRPGGPGRRFLLLLCYLNPNAHSRYRAFFTRSGFRVVDCPPLTSAGKNSADIHMVLDALDVLAHPTRYDEFVIASADADFTPLLNRLRAHDRVTTVVVAGPAAAAYKAVCDSVIASDQFADAMNRPQEAAAEEAVDAVVDAAVDAVTSGLHVPPDESVVATDGLADVAAGIEAARVALLLSVNAADQPLASASAAAAATRGWPEIRESGWAGTGGFGRFVTKFLPELVWDNQPPGHLYDPKRHSPSDLPVSVEATSVSLGVVVDQVCRVTGAPHIGFEQYAVLFEELAADLQRYEMSRTETSKRVRDASVKRGLPVGRPAVNFVMQGLIYSGYGLSSGASPLELAQAFRDNIFTLCRSAQMELSDEDIDQVSNWIAGGLGTS